MKWGVYEYEDSVHVIPCGEDGLMEFPHVGLFNCPCGPVVECVGGDGRTVLRHREECYAC